MPLLEVVIEAVDVVALWGLQDPSIVHLTNEADHSHLRDIQGCRNNAGDFLRVTRSVEQ